MPVATAASRSPMRRFGPMSRRNRYDSRASISAGVIRATERAARKAGAVSTAARFGWALFLNGPDIANEILSRRVGGRDYESAWSDGALADSASTDPRPAQPGRAREQQRPARRLRRRDRLAVADER